MPMQIKSSLYSIIGIFTVVILFIFAFISILFLYNTMDGLYHPSSSTLSTDTNFDLDAYKEIKDKLK